MIILLKAISRKIQDGRRIWRVPGNSKQEPHKESLYQLLSIKRKNHHENAKTKKNTAIVAMRIYSSLNPQFRKKKMKLIEPWTSMKRYCPRTWYWCEQHGSMQQLSDWIWGHLQEVGPILHIVTRMKNLSLDRTQSPGRAYYYTLLNRHSFQLILYDVVLFPCISAASSAHQRNYFLP